MGNKQGKGYYTKHSSMRMHKERQPDAQSPSASHKNSLERHKTSWPASQGELVFCPEYTPKSQLAFEDFEVCNSIDYRVVSTIYDNSVQPYRYTILCIISMIQLPQCVCYY